MPSRVVAFLLSRLWYLTLATCLASMAGCCGWLFWWCDILGSFRVQFLVVLVIAATVFALAGMWRKLMVATLFAMTNLVFIAPLFFTHVAPPSHPPALRAMLLNLYQDNRQHEEVLRVVEQIDPDIIVFVEATDEWVKKLQPLKHKYPFFREVPHPAPDAFGIAIYCRRPIERMAIEYLGQQRLPCVYCSLEVQGRRLCVIGAHVLPPVTPANATAQKDELANLADLIQDQTDPVILLADLNTTSWSSTFQDLTTATGLRDSRIGFGVQPTWPVELPGLRIPIDHCLVSPEIEVHDRRVAANAGSDHFAIYVDIGWQDE